MAIHPLTPESVRLLAASVKLTNPCHIVKELVDNAIDARATSIDVTISADTLERVTVRDNGSGIAVEDFDFLGRRGHTSKLRSFEELQHKGGETLGFRGDALASINSVATVVVTTRTSEEPVATRAQLSPGIGGVVDRRPVSAPVGTIVQATELFKTTPARRYPLLHEKNKTISGIKELFRAYVLARPILKMTFKVAADDNSLWTYVPNGSASVKEVALQLFGKELVANCILTGLRHETSGFALDAFLPRRDFDSKTLRGKAIYVSVDRRPLASSGDLPKSIAKKLKSYISHTLSTTNPPAMFMTLNITCPPRSYDPNVSSLKDEVFVANSNDCEDLVDLSPLDDSEMSQIFEEMGATELMDHLHNKVDASNSSGDAAHSAHEAETVDGNSSAKNVSSKMRTVIKVDMSRSDSNATDDDALTDMVDVTIPAKRPKQAWNQEMHSTARTLDTSALDLHRQINCVAKVDRYAHDGALTLGLPFEDMAQAQAVEEQLRLIVANWMAKRETNMEVEYTMKSQAKGKRIM
ncbi:DNA mismatch repair protein [Purpureocillium lavendulum]|uniref:DNA mismatch repair protein n=1 Tax=Purpureocillium lavendulum TaxID=1247861 RepID=A0AB34G4K1_9HYPO|nr:DNA mismatch repair protein [Purpureocillium lavendulum]